MGPKLYTIQEVPDKGLGVVAATNIPKGTRIMSEAPILQVARTTHDREKLSKALSKDVTALSDAKRQAFFAQRACATRTMLEGDDSPKVRRLGDLARDPTEHAFYGASSQWATSIDQVPTGVPDEVFEAWLWKEENTESGSEQRQYADLRDDSIFPPFHGLPDENYVDLDFFDTQDGSLYSPRKHWCFLAEIIEVGFLFRLQLAVEDKAGRKTQVLFYTDQRGRELGPSLVRQGFTVAILYPEHHGFLDMTTGIRHEEPRVLKIFPVALKELLNLSDKVQQSATDLQGERACQGCDRKATTLKKCGRCNLFWYCDKACQTLAWNERGHKGDCKLLRDKDFQLLLCLGGPFERYHSFLSNQ